MAEIYDVIIAGAGPGGATAAYFLGQAGQRVLVLEKETLPRYKACGGGLSARMLAETFPFPFEEVIETQVKAIAYTFGQQTITTSVPDHSVRTVMRDRFDAHILAHAHAEVYQGMAVRKVTETADRVIVEMAEGDKFQGRYLIGADGANSVVAHAVGLRRVRLWPQPSKRKSRLRRTSCTVSVRPYSSFLAMSAMGTPGFSPRRRAFRWVLAPCARNPVNSRLSWRR